MKSLPSGGFFVSIEQSGLVVFHLLEDCPHERFANEAALVGHTVFIAVAVQCP